MTIQLTETRVTTLGQVPPTRKPDLEHLEWLLTSRTEIQQTLLAFYRFIRENPRGLKHDAEYDVTQLFVAAGFSLWRAVFLSETARDWDTVYPNLEQFLATVISDNAITYQDDKRYRSWTVTYYLENAKFRLLELVPLVREITPNFKLPPLFMIPLRDGPMLLGRTRSTRVAWEFTHRALCLLFQVYNPKFAYIDPWSRPRKRAKSGKLASRTAQQVTFGQIK
jgi:hypothetical protein